MHDGVSFSSYFAGPNSQQVDHLKQFCSVNNEQCVYLWGNDGVGKSHLLQAACREVSIRGEPVSFIPLSDFQKYNVQIFEALEFNQLICIDDVQAIVGDRSWEAALFDLYNRAKEHNTPIIISGSKNAKGLGLELKDLESRLLWGLVLQIKPLLDHEKVTALQLRATQRGFKLSDDACKYLINHFPRDMSSLFQVLNTLDQASLVHKRKITVPFIKQLLDEKAK